MVEDNKTHDNNQGIIIEEVEEAADVFVRDNETYGNSRGIFVHVSDAVSFTSNSIHCQRDRPPPRQRLGRERLHDEHVRQQHADVNDAGTGNCGSGNAPEVFDPC